MYVTHRAFGSIALRFPTCRLTGCETLLAPGLGQPVAIVKDYRDIAHIYAKSEADLFFAQGYNVARDRLFQLGCGDLQAAGTLAEICDRTRQSGR